MFLFFSTAIHNYYYGLRIISDGRGPEKKIKHLIGIVDSGRMFHNQENKVLHQVTSSKSVPVCYDDENMLTFYGNNCFI